MPRRRRACPGGLAYHVMNRSAGRVCIFEDSGDYAAFERVLAEALVRFAMRLCAYVLMPNHWHLVLRPRGDDELSPFMQWLSMTHTQRWHAHRHSVGRGHLYQGRFKCFPVEHDEHFLSLGRYAERNALRANLVARSEEGRGGNECRTVRRSLRKA
jgi:putative transposase